MKSDDPYGGRGGEKIFAVIPCFNEEENIRETLTGLLRVHPEIRVAAVNDGSSDRTAEEIAALNDDRIVLLELPFNSGIGTAVETGLIYAFRNHADYAVKFDSDGQHLAEEIDLLLAPLRAGEADMAIGSRFIGGGADGFKSTLMRRIGIRFFQLLSWLLTGRAMSDSTSGFRAYNSRALAFAVKYYPSFDYPEPEENILMLHNRFRLKEVPCRMNVRQGGSSSIRPIRAVYYMIKVSLAMIMAAARPVKRERRRS